MARLWLDLGNTRLKYWLTDGPTLLAQGAALHLQSPADLLLGLTDRFVGFAPHEVGISSVLDPQANSRLIHTLAPLGVPVRLAQVQAVCQGLRAGYDDPSRLGIDRWLQVLALAGQGRNYCVVGCGTALTIDMLDHQQHLGGYILPSLYLQRESLAQGTRRVQVPDGAFTDLSAGRSTQDAVHHGILLGLVGAVEKCLQHDPTRHVVMTGGDAELLRRFMTVPNPITLAPDLLLTGLRRYFGDWVEPIEP